MADLGRSEAALAAIAEAVARYRELAAARHSTFLERLADSLISLGIRHTEREEFDAAVFADREAVVDEPDPPGGGLGRLTYRELAGNSAPVASSPELTVIATPG